MTGVGGHLLGRGLFATSDVDVDTRPEYLTAYGTWVDPPTDKPEDMHERGYLSVKNPLAGGFVLKLHDSCPASYINGVTGLKNQAGQNIKPNFKWREDDEKGISIPVLPSTHRTLTRTLPPRTTRSHPRKSTAAPWIFWLPEIRC
jgi:hypothetical protein